MRSAFFPALVLALITIPVTAQTVTQPFTFNPVAHELPHIQHGDAAWGDMDGDGDLDVALTGWANGAAVAAIYRNDGGSGTAISFTALPLDAPGLLFSSVAWGDMDGDGDLDLFMSGSSTDMEPYVPFSAVFQNTGTGLVRLETSGLPATYGGSASWGDADSDGDLDVIVTGVDAQGDRSTILALNDGSGSFTTADTDLADVAFGASRFADVNADGRADILVSGVSRNDGFVTQLAYGSANGFTDSGVNLPSVAFSSVDTGDVDGDGDLDIIVSGAQVSRAIFTGQTTMYRNDGGSFQALDVDLAGVLAGRATLGDYDNDGDMDLLVLGAEEALGRRTARIYRNDEGAFVMATLLFGSVFSDASWGDVDGDGDLDLITTGLTSDGIASTTLYVNQRQVVPALPQAPALMTADVEAGTAQLHWNAPASGAGLTFNLRVGTRPGASDVLSAMSDPETGQRLVPAPGNVSALTSWSLEDLEDGTYFWSVQSVNHALVGSSFSTEGTFTISGAVATETEADSALPQTFRVQSVYPNPFRDRATVVLDVPEPSVVGMRVFSALGSRVADISFGMLAAGTHELGWNARSNNGAGLAAGLYFFELKAGQDVRTGSFTILPGL